MSRHLSLSDIHCICMAHLTGKRRSCSADIEATASPPTPRLPRRVALGRERLPPTTATEAQATIECLGREPPLAVDTPPKAVDATEMQSKQGGGGGGGGGGDGGGGGGVDAPVRDSRWKLSIAAPGEEMEGSPPPGALCSICASSDGGGGKRSQAVGPGERGTVAALLRQLREQKRRARERDESQNQVRP